MILRIQRWIYKMRKFCLLIKRGRERLVNIKNSLMNTWNYHSINGILRKKRKQKITLFLQGQHDQNCVG